MHDFRPLRPNLRRNWCGFLRACLRAIWTPTLFSVILRPRSALSFLGPRCAPLFGGPTLCSVFWRAALCSVIWRVALCSVIWRAHALLRYFWRAALCSVIWRAHALLRYFWRATLRRGRVPSASGRDRSESLQKRVAIPSMWLRLLAAFGAFASGFVGPCAWVSPFMRR